MAWLATHASSLAILNPQGVIAAKERNLMVTATALMLLVIVPVWILAFGIAWRYRATNLKARYQPNWNTSGWLEGLWWGIPCAIIVVLSILTWTSTHELDPYRPISSQKEPLMVQVVALQYKWLFIYPEHNIATVDYLQLPVGRPVNFVITADAPMNSFWIPQLGGQIYAMPGMSTRLSLQADYDGAYRGSSANLSGTGFADMNFTARAVSDAQFEQWLVQVRASGGALTDEAYKELARPGVAKANQTFSSTRPGLYDEIVNTYHHHAVGGHSEAMP